MKLTDLKCRHAKPQPKEYKISDGQGLSLLIAPNGSKYWRWRYSYGGKNKGLAFGVYPEVTLLEAREKAFEARRQLRDGKDPAQLRREQKINAIDKTQNTFEAATRAWMKHFAAKWSPKHAQRIDYRLKTELFPKIGNMALSEITPLLLTCSIGYAIVLMRNNETAVALETLNAALEHRPEDEGLLRAKDVATRLLNPDKESSTVSLNALDGFAGKKQSFDRSATYSPAKTPSTRPVTRSDGPLKL